MRFTLGIIVGCLLTVGAAYLHDAAEPNPAPVLVADASSPAPSGGRMVNWEVVNRSVRGVDGWVRSQWAWISGQLDRAG